MYLPVFQCNRGLYILNEVGNVMPCEEGPGRWSVIVEMSRGWFAMIVCWYGIDRNPRRGTWLFGGGGSLFVSSVGEGVFVMSDSLFNKRWDDSVSFFGSISMRLKENNIE